MPEAACQATRGQSDMRGLVPQCPVSAGQWWRVWGRACPRGRGRSQL